MAGAGQGDCGLSSLLVCATSSTCCLIHAPPSIARITCDYWAHCLPHLPRYATLTAAPYLLNVSGWQKALPGFTLPV